MDIYKERWKVGVCFSGENCWCRTVITEKEWLDDDGELEYVLGPASVDKEMAEYLVNLHNKNF